MRGINTYAKLKHLLESDPWLKPFESTILHRHARTMSLLESLTDSGRKPIGDLANGHHYYGLHQTAKDWVFREWAPNATAIYLIGDFNNWEESEKYRLKSVGTNGDWEIHVQKGVIKHGQHYKLKVYWTGGQGERIPAWCKRVVQDSQTHIFSAQVWQPSTPYKWRFLRHKPRRSPLLIYECHIGMSQDAEKVGTYNEFRTNILPRIAAAGYNCIQLMAIAEHPYYGSFGYHVSSFFAPSSRFGTPEELKMLIDEAHGMGLSVVMDIVHSHAVKNEVEGLGLFAGDPHQYFAMDNRRNHPAWDSLCFDYGKPEVVHFLLSNCKYWLEEYHFDGFRFDGVTSMIYESHGLGETFTSYDDYYDGNQNEDAISYLTLANLLIHSIQPTAFTIAEEVSGMPGVALPVEKGGMGFDYRMAMNIPDYWIKLIKEKSDEQWAPSSILWQLCNRRENERTVSYCESHDQALVGDKTIIFRLVDSDMYWHFKIGDETETVKRGIALHKIIRLLTISTINGAYLCFMGNEFGHPEWIDFPREGNGWSYKYARRQWHLADAPELCYKWLGAFDHDMIATIQLQRNFVSTKVVEVWHNDVDQILAYSRGSMIFVVNLSPSKSFTDYGLLVKKDTYRIVLNTDDTRYGGQGLVDEKMVYNTIEDNLYKRQNKAWLKLYIPARSALVLTKQTKK